MFYNIRIRGVSPIIHNNGQAVDTQLPANREKKRLTDKRGTNKVEADIERIAELETQLALYLDDEGNPTITPQAIRTCIESAAKKSKQGPKVREGLLVTETTAFDYDRERYGEGLATLMKTTQFRTAVARNRSRIIVARAMFELPWECEFVVETDDGLVERTDLEQWVSLAGRRIGLGDWRPEKSGVYGRFELVSIVPQT